MKHIKSQMHSGNKLSRYCHQNFPSPELGVHAWTTEKQWKLYSMYCALTVHGKHSLAVWELKAQCMTVFWNGKRLVCFKGCGKLAF